MRMFDLQDKIVLAVEKSLETILSPNESNRPYPAENIADISLDKNRLKKSRSLMRVNHAGEIAAQALYNGQAVFARSEETIAHLEKSAEEEKEPTSTPESFAASSSSTEPGRGYCASTPTKTAD